jgi:enoyl-CoA hydratase
MKVVVEQRGHVLLIGINRPDKRNAFDLELIDQFGAAYERLGTDPDVRVGVVHAMGDHFSAGLDLAEVGGKSRRWARRRWQGTTPSTRSVCGRRLSRSLW